ncbi:T9SS type A sorting domain-containing protein [Bizionia sp. M204]|uniref:T9SS type A sorting domain-containing protein n=1 Tax=Bizionia sp. M204 TaxID=2675331 RepID=UPI00205AB8E9|nr:T9SS type A sorting domain-containing protein [Bizionia sp. M204]UPS91481.1 T9SS type A sorting domain-containing protein [Bizionia sp. M204]
MKKNYILPLLLCLLTWASHAQAVVIDQPVNAAGSALVSFQGNDGVGVYVSDDFVLPSNTILGEIDIYGLLSNTVNFTNLLSFNVFIYADNAGVPNGNPSVPGTGVVELSGISATDFTLNEDGAGAANFTVRVTDANGGTQITLPAGTYWIAAFPTVNEAFSTTGLNRWNWFGSTAAVSGEEPVLIDPSNLFGAGATNWTNISGLLGESFPSSGFQIRDEAPLSVKDFSMEKISVTPNPAQDYIHINFPQSVSNFSTELYDIAGKLVLKSNNIERLNIGKLHAGVYILKVATDTGSVTKRIIKS